jgi:ketosteroid isomerase-like protein
MSENLDLVRSIYADWERGDFRSAGWAAPEIAFVRVDGPDPGEWVGREELAGSARHRLNPWEHFRIEADSYRALDEERVLVLVRAAGRGKTSGVELDQIGARGAQVFQVRDRKVIKLVSYLDRDRALADLGLRE